MACLKLVLLTLSILVSSTFVLVETNQTIIMTQTLLSDLMILQSTM